MISAALKVMIFAGIVLGSASAVLAQERPHPCRFYDGISFVDRMAGKDSPFVELDRLCRETRAALLVPHATAREKALARMIQGELAGFRDNIVDAVMDQFHTVRDAQKASGYHPRITQIGLSKSSVYLRLRRSPLLDLNAVWLEEMTS